MNCRSNAGDRGGSPGAVVPLRLMFVVIVVSGILAWCNVEYTFAFVDRYMSGSLGMRLLGSYLPHAIGLLVCVLGLITCYGRLSPRELGLSLRGLLVALPITLSFWIAVNLWVWLDAYQTTGSWELNSQLQEVGWAGLVLNLVVTQLIGNALLEEILFRGFVFEQVRRRLNSYWGNRTLARALASIGIATLVTVPVFVAIHIPIRVHNGILGDALISNLIRVAIWGFIFTMLYASSQNLWLAVGIHALTNRPCLWLEPQHSIRSFELAICAALILAFAAVTTLRHQSKLIPVVRQSARGA